jgi:hypothetical protein
VRADSRPGVLEGNRSAEGKRATPRASAEIAPLITILSIILFHFHHAWLGTRGRDHGSWQKIRGPFSGRVKIFLARGRIARSIYRISGYLYHSKWSSRKSRAMKVVPAQKSMVTTTDRARSCCMARELQMGAIDATSSIIATGRDRSELARAILPAISPVESVPNRSATGRGRSVFKHRSRDPYQLTMNARNLQKRRDIAGAYRADSTVSYAALAKRFHTSNRVIAEATAREIEYWDELLCNAIEPGRAAEQWEHAFVAVREKSEGVLELLDEGHATWVNTEADTITEVCDVRGRDGWRLVSVVKTTTGRFEAFSGTYELVFARVTNP